MSLLVLLSSGFPHTITVGAPGAQGATVSGTHGMGVSTPRAAAVAAATVGLAGFEHIPNVGNLLSMIVPAGILHIVTVCWLATVSGAGATPKEQVQTAV